MHLLSIDMPRTLTMIGPNKNYEIFIQKIKEVENVDFHEQHLPLTESFQSDRPHIIAAVL
jgi:hypothetical protein